MTARAAHPPKHARRLPAGPVRWWKRARHVPVHAAMPVPEQLRPLPSDEELIVAFRDALESWEPSAETRVTGG